jgi:hypothetical protein
MEIPVFKKTEQQMIQLMPLLEENFMTKDLSHDLRFKIANAM